MLEGRVGEERVLEGEDAIVAAGAERGHELVEAPATPAPQTTGQAAREVVDALALLRRRLRLGSGRVLAGTAREALPSLRHRGEPRRKLVRQRDVAEHHRKVRPERARPARHPGPVRGPPAEVIRAHARRLLEDVHPVRPAEQAKQALGVVGGDRQPAGARAAAGEDRGHGLARAVVDAGGAGKPRRGSSESGEVGIPPWIDAPARVEQRGQWQLVEDDQHDGRACGHRGRARIGLVGEHELGHRRRAQEESEEDQRRGGQDGQEGAQPACARVGDRGGDARDAGDHEDHRRSERPDPLEDLDGEQRDERGHEREVQGAPERRPHQAGQYLQGNHPRRWGEREQHREADDLCSLRAPRGEELGVATQQVEQGLSDREAPERRQVEEGDQRGAPRRRRLGVAGGLRPRRGGCAHPLGAGRPFPCPPVAGTPLGRAR